MFSNKVIFGIAIFAICVCLTQGKQHYACPWMCLERCNENVEADLEEILRLGPSVYNYVSIEAYDLDWGATITDCGYSRVGPKLINAGIKVMPMITTANIGKLRDLWNDMDGFIAKAMNVARQNKDWITGFNIDFEPEGGEDPTYNDAVNYANFLDKFARALHAEGFILTVDIAQWSNLWQDELLSQTSVDRFITMQTYTLNLDDFKYIVKYRLANYGVSKFGVGLDTWVGFSGEDIKARLDFVRECGIDTVAIWATPVPSDWVPYVKEFVNSD